MSPFWKRERSDTTSHQDNRSIELLQEIGRGTKSANGMYDIAWNDGPPGGGIAGYRESGHGTYTLFERGRAILNGRLERPNDGHVANNGTFAINDWMFGQGLKGTFYVIDRTGKKLVEREFGANLLNCGISDDGRYALCQTANSDNDDGFKLTVFDTITGGIVFRTEPPRGAWASSYMFDLKNDKIYLDYQEMGRFAFSMTGEFLDKEKWLEARIRMSDGVQLLRIAQEQLREMGGAINQETASRLMPLIQDALKKDIEKRPGDHARAHRMMGEILEEQENLEAAVHHYREAIRIDSNVGAKRRLERLEKSLSEQSMNE